MRLGKSATFSWDLLKGLALSHRRPCNIAAFHLGRSGSRVLGDLLTQHPRIDWVGELFSPGRLSGIAKQWPLLPRDPLTILRLRMTMAGRKCFGFETQPTEIEHLNMTLPQYAQLLEDMGFARFVILERRNHLRRIVSMMVARSTSQWHLKNSESPPLVCIELNVHKLLLGRGRDTERRSLVAQLQREEESISALKKVFGGRQLLCLTYEDDIAPGPEIAYRRVCEFSGSADHPVTVRWGKTNPYHLSDILTNFSQVEKALIGTSFEWMLYS
jgi:hypothetical protein